MVKGVELNSPTEEEKNMWVAQFWNWRVAQPSPEQGGCLVNSTTIGSNVNGDCPRGSDS